MRNELDADLRDAEHSRERKAREMRRIGATRVGSATVLGILLLASCSSGEAGSSSGDGAVPASLSPQILNDCPELPGEGPLEPGDYRWSFSDPNIDFTIESPGWKWFYGGGFQIVDAEATDVEGLHVP